MAFERGTVIAGKYCVERVIGQGGMGIVLAARHLGLDEMVAVKLIRDVPLAGSDALARFQREARAAARIKSEHIARVLDVDTLPSTSDEKGAPYIVMELIDGVDLDALVKRRGPLPSTEVASYVIQACEGLAEAHTLGMVHRDLKLKNLFLTKRRDGRALIKVIDFGVVKLGTSEEIESTLPDGVASPLGGTRSTLTGDRTLVGSLHYMAPEQMRASNVVDAQADVWSLGVCMYHLLTGSLPFDGDTMIAILAAVQGLPAPDVRERASDVPAALAHVIARCLEKDVRRRFANVAELAHALAPLSSDPAGAARVENILRSGAPSFALTGASEHTAASPAPVVGRMESTIAAGVGSLSSESELRPPSPRARGVALAAFVAAVVVVVYFGRGRLIASEHLGASSAAAEASITESTSLPMAAQEPPTIAPAVSALGAVPSSLVAMPSAVPTSVHSAAHTLAKGRGPRRAQPPAASGSMAAPPAPAPPAPAPPAPAPKPEPSSAYDHF